MASGYYEIFQEGSYNLIDKEVFLTHANFTYTGNNAQFSFSPSDSIYTPTQLRIDFTYSNSDVADFDGLCSISYENVSMGSVFIPHSSSGNISKTFDLELFDKQTLQFLKSFQYIGGSDLLSYVVGTRPYFDVVFDNFGTESASVEINNLSLSFFAPDTPNFQNHETLLNPKLIEGNMNVIQEYSPYTEGFPKSLLVNFSGFDNSGFEKVGKATIRLNARNTSDQPETSSYSRTRLQVFGTNHNLDKLSSERDSGKKYKIFTWGQSDLILNSGYQSYDIDLSFINGERMDSNGFTGFKEDRDWVSLFEDGKFVIRGLISGIDILDGYLYLENRNDEYLPLHCLGGEGLFNENITIYPSGDTTGFNLLKEEHDPDYYFDQGYFGFNNLSLYSHDSSNRIKGITTVVTIDGYGETREDIEYTPEVVNYFSSNLNRDEYSENNIIKDEINNSNRLMTSGTISIGPKFTMLFHGFEGNGSKLLDIEGLSLKTNTSIREYILSVEENDVWVDYSFGNVSHLTNEINFLLERDGDVFTIENLNDDYFLNTGISSNTISGNPSSSFNNGTPSFFSGSTGVLCEVGFNNSLWSDQKKQEYKDHIYSFEEVLNGSGYVQVEIPPSDGLNAIPWRISYDGSMPGISSPFFKELNLPHRVDYYNLDNNISGFYLDMEVSSPVDMTYSGHFRYGNHGYLRFYGLVPSGENIETRLYADDSYYEKFDSNTTNLVLDSNFLIQDFPTYSGTVKLHNTSLGFDSWLGAAIATSGLDLYAQSNELSEGEVDLFVRGESDFNSGVDLSVYGSYYDTKTINFTLEAFSVETETVPLYLANILTSSRTLSFNISGHPYTEEQDIELYVFGAHISNSGIDLHTKGMNQESTELLFYTIGLSASELTSGIDFYSAGSSAPNSVESINFYSFSNMDRDNSINMNIRGDMETEGSSISFVLASEAFDDKSFDLYMENTREDESESLDFYLDVPMSGVESAINMYIGPEETMYLETKPLEFSLKVNDIDAEPVNFYVDGALVDTEQVTLFMSGIGTETDSVVLYSHGF